MAVFLKRLDFFRVCVQHAIKVRCFSLNNIADIKDKVDEYQQNGVVCLRGVFDKKWIEMVSQGIAKNIKNPSKYCDWLVNEDGNEMFFNDYFNYTKIPEYYKYVTLSPAAEIAGKLMMSSRSLFFHEHVFHKEHGSSKETPWHHDHTYYPLEGFQNCSIWMPTTPVRRTSSVKFIRRSHIADKCFIPVKFETHENYAVTHGDLDANMVDIKSYLEHVNDEDFVQYEVEPGDCIAFHMRCVHGTEKSTAADTRQVMVTRWLGDDAIYARRPWESSPPAELLPSDFKIGDKFVDNNGFLVPWKR